MSNAREQTARKIVGDCKFADPEYLIPCGRCGSCVHAHLITAALEDAAKADRNRFVSLHAAIVVFISRGRFNADTTTITMSCDAMTALNDRIVALRADPERDSDEWKKGLAFDDPRQTEGA